MQILAVHQWAWEQKKKAELNMCYWLTELDSTRDLLQNTCRKLQKQRWGGRSHLISGCNGQEHPHNSREYSRWDLYIQYWTSAQPIASHTVNGATNTTWKPCASPTSPHAHWQVTGAPTSIKETTVINKRKATSPCPTGEITREENAARPLRSRETSAKTHCNGTSSAGPG